MDEAATFKVVLIPAVREFLLAPRFAVLATTRADGAPQLSVIWYELRGDRIMFNTKHGRAKDRNIVRDPRVSLCVEDRYRVVTVDGHVIEAVRDPAVALADILHLGIRYDGAAEARRQFDEIWSAQRRASYYVSIDRVHALGFDG